MLKTETILETDKVKVTIMCLPALTEAPWHFHREVTEDCFCLAGRMEVQTLEPIQTFSLQPGSRCTVKVKIIHRVVNATKEEARFLLVQGTGQYDYIDVNPKKND
jgi:quercetin dioxygenase-like cupin family protein